MRALARGRGPRAAADRGALPAVQPPVEISGTGGLAEADRGGVPPAVGGPRAGRRRRGLPGAVLLPAHGRAGRRRRSTTRCRCASARTSSRPGPPRRPARWPSWADARRPASTRSPPRSTRPAPPCRSGPRPTATREPMVDALMARIERAVRPAAVRGGGGGPVPADRAAARHRPDAAAGRADPASPSWSPPGATTIGGWEIVVVRHGRLAAAATSPPREHPRPTLDMARATAETVLPGPGPVPAASAEETERILAWLEQPDTRLVETSGDWVSPARGAARFTACSPGRKPPRRAETRPFAHR